MVAFIEDDKVGGNINVINDAYPTIYRIQSYSVFDEKYHVPYFDRFEEG